MTDQNRAPDTGASDSIWSAFLATWRAMVTDKGAFTLIFIGGIIYSFFYPLPYEREVVQRVPVVIVDEDQSAISRQITRYAMAHPSIDVVRVTPSLEEAQHMIWRNEAAGSMYLPNDLQRNVLSGKKAEVEVAGNGLYLMLNKAALNGLAEVVGTVSAGIDIKRLAARAQSEEKAIEERAPVSVNPVALFNIKEGYGAYVVPGVAVLILQQTLLMAMTMMFGTWFQKKSFPYGASLKQYAGMLCAFSLAALLNAAYYFGFVLWMHDYPRGGNFAGLVVLAVLFSLTIAACGIVLGMLFRTRERGMQLLIATSMPILFVSGLTWPETSLPTVLYYVRWLLPSTSGVQGFIAVNQLGASLYEVRRELVILTCLLVAFVWIGCARWKTIVNADRAS